MTGKHSIQGGWRGRYFYTGDNHPHGFEAVFVEMDGHLEGNILDDGRLGEAVVGGNFSYPVVRFTKFYHAAGTSKVTYHGMMSDDGKTMQGRWRIDAANSGTWSAARFDDGEDLTFDIEDINEIETDETTRKDHEVQPARSTGVV